MAKFIDTVTLHDVNVNGTIFKIRRMDRRTWNNFLIAIGVTFPFLKSSKEEIESGEKKIDSHVISKNEWNDLMEPICQSVDSIDGRDKDKVVEDINNLELEDIVLLVVELLKLNTLNEVEQKN